MFRRPYYIALALVLLLVLILFNLPSRATASLKLAIGSFFLPLFGLAGSAEVAQEKAGSILTPRSALLKELEKLRIENEELRLHALQTAEIWKENNELREALRWSKQAPWKLKLARVILRDPANWWRTLHIDLGRNAGITTNMPVLTSRGIVGKVIQTGLGTSQVALIGDPNCGVAVRVQETKDEGLVTSSPDRILDPSIVVLSFLDRNSEVQPGHHVVTSGRGGVFPAGIPVGRVVDTEVIEFGLYIQARLKLAADLNHLDYVFVLTQ